MKDADGRVPICSCFVYGLGLMLIILVCGCETRPLAEQTCTITGRIVTVDESAPITGARVLVSVPEINLRSLSKGFGLIYTGVTGVDGRYTIVCVPARTGVSVELIAKAKGYQTPWSADNIDEPMPKIILRAGVVEAAELKLKKGHSSFFSGTIVDELGKPIRDVNVSTNSLIDNSDESGAFEILDERIEKDSLNTILFMHPDYISTWIDDIFQTPLAERERMRVVLKSGTKIEGILLDPDGKPMPSTLVQIKTIGLPVHSYRGAMTNDSGRFSIKGIVPNAYRLCATTPTASGEVVVDLTKDNDNFTLRLATAYTGRSRTVRFLGMTLAEADEALSTHWGVRYGSVIVLDPGTEVGVAPLKMATWSRILNVQASGNDNNGGDVTSLWDLISAIVNEAARQPQGVVPITVGIVTTLPSPRGDVTSSLLLKLRMSDIEEAQTLMKTLPMHSFKAGEGSRRPGK